MSKQEIDALVMNFIQEVNKYSNRHIMMSHHNDMQIACDYIGHKSYTLPKQMGTICYLPIIGFSNITSSNIVTFLGSTESFKDEIFNYVIVNDNNGSPVVVTFHHTNANIGKYMNIDKIKKLKAFW